MSDEQSRVTIIAVGCWNYHHLLKLTGPAQDIRNLKDVFIDDEDLALYSPHQYIERTNVTSEELRTVINDYVYDRGAENDILLFYFSGHGAPIGSNDFAFCTVDTKPVPGENFILPMTAVKFSDILSTLWLKRVTPVFVIDACYSGAAGGSLELAINQLVDGLKGEVQRKYAGNYAILCSAPTDDEVEDNPDGEGGFFSHSITRIAQTGTRSKRNPTLTLEQIYPELKRLSEQSAYTPYPMLFLGTTLPSFSIFRNVNFRPLEYRLQPHLVSVLQVLWENGNLPNLRPGEIADETGKMGAYGNHNKLSFAPWQLVEDVPGSRPKRRRLSQRGIEFMRGNLSVARDIVLDQNTNEYVEKPETEFVSIQDFA